MIKVAQLCCTLTYIWAHCWVVYLCGLDHILAVLAEWKPPVYDNTRGIVLVTATTRRNSPNVRSLN